MKNDLIYSEMKRCGADGVDFVPIWLDETRPATIISSFTKKQWENERGYPKSDRRYWRLDKDGRKIYCDGRSEVNFHESTR